MNGTKRFLVINTSFFGDILLTNPLCQNIKRIFPDSEIIFIANKPFVDAARYGEDVDEVIAYDKKGKHHGLSGAWKFYQQYKKRFAAGFDAAFVIYGNERGIVLAKLFGAKKIYADNSGLINCLVDNPRHIDYHGHTKVQYKNSVLLEFYTKKNIVDLPMQYILPKDIYFSLDKKLSAAGISSEQKLICICTTSKKKEKDMPVQDCKVLMQKLRQSGYLPVFVGAGQSARDYSAELKQSKTDFLDMTDKTSIPELGALLAKCSALISVDTGTMHLGLSVKTPVVCLFYIHTPQHLAAWAPEQKLYKSVVLKENISPDAVMMSLKSIL